MRESLRAWVGGKTSEADNVVGMSYRPASLGEEVGEAFFKLFEEVSVSQTCDTSRKDSLAGHNQSIFLESIRGNFLIQVLDGQAAAAHRWICCSLTRRHWLGMW